MSWRLVVAESPLMAVLGSLLALGVHVLTGVWVLVMLVVAREVGIADRVRAEREARWVQPGVWR